MQEQKLSTVFPTAWSFVYFIGGIARGPIKIGTSACPELRLKTLQTGYPYRLAVLASFAGGEEEEEATHQLLVEHKLEGEWFRRSAEILQFINLVSCRVAFSMIAERFAKQRAERAARFSAQLSNRPVKGRRVNHVAQNETGRAGRAAGSGIYPHKKS